MSSVRFNGTIVAARNALRLHKYRKAAYQYNWTDEEDKVLPEHYKQRCEDFMRKEPVPVHYRPAETKWRLESEGKVRVRNMDGPVEVTFPEECNKGLWGGEGIIMATYRTNWKRRNDILPKMWRPNLYSRIFYSEILNKWYHIVVTLRVCDLIDDAFGFDFYILKTHERDLNSRLGMQLKREMLLTLARKDMYPDDLEKTEKIYNKYKEFIIPEEEAEWIGLPVKEAVRKAKELESKQNPTVPLKYKLAKALVERLEELSLEKRSEK